MGPHWGRKGVEKMNLTVHVSEERKAVKETFSKDEETSGIYQNMTSNTLLYV